MPSTLSTQAPLPHPSFEVLEKLAGLAIDGTLQGANLLAAARLLCQDRWHQEKMALAQAKLDLQTQKEARLAKQNRQERRLKKLALELKTKEYKLKKQVAKKQSQPSWADEPLPTVTFSAVAPSERMVQLTNELGIASGGVVYDSRQRSAPAGPPSSSNSPGP
jgi:hypothetical protein